MYNPETAAVLNTCTSIILQVKYVTNNPSIPVPLGTYYQCGDILINDP